MGQEGFDTFVWVLALYRSLTVFAAVLATVLVTCTIGLMLQLSQGKGPHGHKVQNLSID